MKSSLQGMRTLAAGAAAGAMTAFWGVQALAQDLMGQPTPKGIALQPAAAPLKHDAIFFHDVILMPIITIITLFVAALLIWVIFRYNARANPVPAKFSHNTTIEVIWTLVPVLILVFIAIFSFRLLFTYHDMPRPDLTVKAVGYQWYWGYEYPDHEVGEFISNMLPEDEARAAGVPYLLAANEPMVVPVGKTVRVLVTAADVIHSFAMPAFGLKTDAIPGRVNETWFTAEKEGVYYGQCSELCGVDHAYMPIEIRVVSQAEFDAWVASKGGNPAGLAASTEAEATAPAVDQTATDASATEGVAEDAAVSPPPETAAPAAAAAAN